MIHTSHLCYVYSVQMSQGYFYYGAFTNRLLWCRSPGRSGASAQSP